MGTDEPLAVSTMSRPTQGPSSSLEEFPQKIGVPLQEPKNKQPLNHLPQEPPKSWGKSWLVSNPVTRFLTASARAGALLMGMTTDDVVQVVQDLRAVDFFKSMTSYRSSKVWHDVYKPAVRGWTVYLKVQIVEQMGVVISFKEV